MKKTLKFHYALLFTILIVGNNPNFVFAQKKGNALLWKVEGENIKESYIFGTFHMIPQADFVLKDKVNKAFEASEQVVLELDMDDPDMQIKLMQNMNMKGGESLKGLMKEEDYKELDDELKTINEQGILPFNNVKPFFVSAMLMLKFMGEKPASFEKVFLEMAHEGGKEVLGIETVEEQMQVFEDISYESQIASIMQMLEDQEATNKYIRKLIEAYKVEDTRVILSLMDDYLTSEEEKEILLTKRNKSWVERVGKLAAEKSTFFGVGAGHLPGQDGLIALLKKQGYKVTAVKDKK